MVDSHGVGGPRVTPYEVWCAVDQEAQDIYSLWNDRHLDEYYELVHGYQPRAELGYTAYERRLWFYVCDQNYKSYMTWLCEKYRVGDGTAASV